MMGRGVGRLVANERDDEGWLASSAVYEPLCTRPLTGLENSLDPRVVSVMGFERYPLIIRLIDRQWI